MMFAYPNPNAIREQFDAALEEAEKRFAAAEAARRVHPGDTVEFVRAETAYRRAMLIYHSCELELRTSGTLNRSRRHSTCEVLLYGRGELVRASLADLLRIWGYKATVTATLAAMRTARKELSHAAAVA